MPNGVPYGVPEKAVPAESQDGEELTATGQRIVTVYLQKHYERWYVGLQGRQQMPFSQLPASLPQHR
jgi:hypothetical protein